MALRRRDLFRLGGVSGGLGLLGGLTTLAGRRVGSKDPAPLARFPIDCSSAPQISGTGVGYAPGLGPPGYLGVGSRDNLHEPPPRRPPSLETREFDLSVTETTLEVADGQNVRVWAYAGSVPGPIVRASVGDRLRIVLSNHTGAPHSVHFHGVHDVSYDGLGRVPSAKTLSYEIAAGPVGLHPYHCHVPPYGLHLAKGMFGAMIVDPLEPRPAAHEFVLCLCAFDLDRDGRAEVYTWNGVANYYDRFPLKVPVGELVRLYVVNMVEHDAIASFHLHAQTFDLYRSGTSLTPDEHTDIVSLGPAERAMLEFRLPRRGRYMFHPHQSWMAERGAMGWIVAI